MDRGGGRTDIILSVNMGLKKKSKSHSKCKFPFWYCVWGRMTASANQDSVLIIKDILNYIIKNRYFFFFHFISKASFK